VGYVEDLRGKKQGEGRPRWRARYRDPAGRERSKSFTRRVDAERFLVSIEDAKLRGAYVDPAAGRVLFSEWAERWYNTTAHLKPSTRHDYRMLLDHQVLPEFGDWTLASIDTLAVKEWRADLLADGLSPKRAGKALQVLSQILASAVEGGRLARNAATGVKPPKVQRKEMHFLDAEQVEWLAAVAELRYRPLILFAAYTGLRPCELVALRVGRLDLLRCTARVVEAAVEVSRLEWGPVKTHEARVVRMPQSVAEEVAASLAARPHRPEALMFTAPMVGRSVGPISSGTASSQLSLPRTRQSPSCRRTGARPRCRTACGSTIIGIPALACSSPRREHQGGAGAAGACDRQHHPRHLRAPGPV
jgi:integrase